MVNILMDPVPLHSEITHPNHPKRSYDFKRKVKLHTRTECPTKYYIIDFGLSRTFSPGEELVAPVSKGGDRSVPEYKDPTRAVSNPFAIDVYCLGSMIRRGLLNVCIGFGTPWLPQADRPLQESHSLEFMRPLVEDMTRKVPEERPTIDEAFTRFEKLRLSLSEWTLRSRFVYRDEFLAGRMYRACRHVVRTAKYLYRGLPALPTPPPSFLRKSDL